MAICNKCGREVGCGCNLITGSCHKCYNESITSNAEIEKPLKKIIKKTVYQNLPDAPPNTEFSNILKNQELSRAEKLKRINDILEKARQ